MTHEERYARIAELRQELNALLAAEAPDNSLEAVRAECLQLIKDGKPMAAVKHFRFRVGCGLREAYHYIEGLRARS